MKRRTIKMNVPVRSGHLSRTRNRSLHERAAEPDLVPVVAEQHRLDNGLAALEQLAKENRRAMIRAALRRHGFTVA